MKIIKLKLRERFKYKRKVIIKNLILNMFIGIHNFEKKKKLFNSVSNMTVVPVSKWLEAQTKLSHLKGFNSTVIQNGVDLKIFKPSPSESFRKKHNLIGKFILLGVASNWSKRKGFFGSKLVGSFLNYLFQIGLAANRQRHSIHPHSHRLQFADQIWLLFHHLIKRSFHDHQFLCKFLKP